MGIFLVFAYFATQLRRFPGDRVEIWFDNNKNYAMRKTHSLPGDLSQNNQLPIRIVSGKSSLVLTSELYKL